MDSPTMMFMNVFGFNLLGVFVILFGVSVFISREIKILGKISAPFFIITGILMFLVGVFPCDANCFNVTEMGALHEFVSDTPFIIMSVALVLFAVDVARNKKLRVLTPIILSLGLVTLYFAQLSLLSVPEPVSPGIIQRIAIGTPFFIMFLIALKLWRVQNFIKKGIK